MAKQTEQEIKQSIISDLTICNGIYIEKFPGSNLITRDFYRDNGKFKEKEITKHFGSFEALKKEVFKEEVDTIVFKKKIHSLETENRNLLKENQDLIKNSVIEDVILSRYEERLNAGLFIEGNQSIKIAPYKISVKNKEAILMLSDFHLGETVDSLEIQGINSYNHEIMVKRLDRIFFYFVHYCLKYEITKVNLLLLGDLISGSHHPELMKTNQWSDVECIFYLQEYLTNKIVEIEKNFTEIKIEILVGNHSRIPEGKPEFKKAGVMNYEFILAKQMKMFFDLTQKDNKEKKIKVNVSESLFNVIEVAGRRFLITHGHILAGGSNSFAGIPYYGLSMQSSKLDGAFKQFEHLQFNDILMGHLHSTAKVKTPIGNIFINGSIIGTGQFALYKMRVVGQAEQTMLVIEDGNVNSEITLRGED
jgi:hypothetical protein